MKNKSCLSMWTQSLLIVLSLLHLNVLLDARIVRYSEARLAAVRLLEMELSHPDLRLTKDTFWLDRVEQLIYQHQPVAYLVKLKPQGFMILSDITEITPQVFVSFSGDFDKLREHPFLIEILDRLRYDKVHQYYLGKKSFLDGFIRTEEAPDSNQIARNERSWSTLLRDSVSVIGLSAEIQSADALAPMIETSWNQNVPYWNYTPRIGGKETYTGCSATAMAQVMFYWNYPDRGQGSHSYRWNGQNLSANFDHLYRWDLMRLSYSGGYTGEQADAVARLMSDVGIAIDMNYGLDGSYAYADDNNAFVNFFKYSQDVRWVNRNNFSNWTAWFNILKQQMVSRLPVILSIYKPESGHAVVVDGFRASPSNQIHVNMGWGGAADNYYTVDNIYGYGNANWDWAVINIHPMRLSMTIQVSAGGTTNPGPGTYTYNYATGILLHVTAVPYINFRFLNWSGGASGTQNPIDIPLDRNKSVLANFQRIIYAPLNAAGQKVFNRSLSQAEYINILNFEPNQDNLNISCYKIYLVENGQRTEVASLDTNTFKFWHRGVNKKKEYLYEIVAVNDEPREGDPAVLVVR